ncbi:hypothetical protein [Neptuniibacter sp. QD37_11]|uniref:hypothetical protein n=1 Tax=Neptuniibacter sp. QD37_11 TaxID=3398209 RepID=UPI0039F5C07B
MNKFVTENKTLQWEIEWIRNREHGYEGQGHKAMVIENITLRYEMARIRGLVSSWLSAKPEEAAEALRDLLSYYGMAKGVCVISTRLLVSSPTRPDFFEGEWHARGFKGMSEKIKTLKHWERMVKALSESPDDPVIRDNIHQLMAH